MKLQCNSEKHCRVEFIFSCFICHHKWTIKLRFHYTKEEYQSNMDRKPVLLFDLRIKYFNLYLSLPMYQIQLHYMDRAMNFIEKYYLKSINFVQQALFENSAFIFTLLDYRHLFQVLSSAKGTNLAPESTNPVMLILGTLQWAHFLLLCPPHLQRFWKHRH